MSTAQALKNLETAMADELDREIASLSSKVVPLKQAKVERYTAPDPEGEQDRLAAAHRHSISKRKQRIADTRKGLKATLASITASKKEAKAKFDALIADLAEREVEAKAQAAKDIEADQKIVASCEAALEILTAE